MGLIREALGRGIGAFRANFPGLLAILAVGGAILTAYGLHPGIRGALDDFAVWKDGLGLLYPVLVYPVVGGLMPMALAWVLSRRRPPARAWAVVVLFWPERGIEIEILYRGMGRLIGTTGDLPTVLAKTAIDMLVYSPLWALPVYLLVLAWQQGESPLAVARTGAFWRERYLPGLLANWLLWVPGVLMVYSLPAGLQMPVSNLFLIIWVLVAALIGQRR